MHSFAQWTGMAVTAIVVFGTDMDVIYAVPLGILAGALATFLWAAADQQALRGRTARVTHRSRPAKRLV
jgi:hypothetical protein